ncbi:transcription elongation factor GreA [Candidatus Campbellbacteria bacterium]|nr:MAG: transcription elongation factor GreA [Candidatus Campbellbacteria bacterium]
MVYLSKEKLEELKKELEELTTVGRKEIAERLDEAKSYGDLKENAEYHQAREDQGIMESRILEIDDIIKNSEVFKKHKATKVELGCVVVIAKKGSKEKNTYEIVGSQDADIFAGKLDRHAPLAVAMMEKTEGEFFDFKKPNGESITYKVVDIK